MATVALALRVEDGALIEMISESFEESDVDLLRKFVKHMSRVRTCGLLVRGMPTISNISITSEAGMKLTCAPYANAELHEFLHVLRPVILHKEPASFQAISDLLCNRFTNLMLSDYLKRVRNMFEHGELRGYMQIFLGDQPFFDKSILKLWLNAEQYHTDEKKAEDWTNFEQSLTTENARALVMAQLHSKVKALMHLEDIANFVIEKHKSVK